MSVLKLKLVDGVSTLNPAFGDLSSMSCESTAILRLPNLKFCGMPESGVVQWYFEPHWSLYVTIPGH